MNAAETSAATPGEPGAVDLRWRDCNGFVRAYLGEFCAEIWQCGHKDWALRVTGFGKLRQRSHESLDDAKVDALPLIRDVAQGVVDALDSRGLLRARLAPPMPGARAEETERAEFDRLYRECLKAALGRGDDHDTTHGALWEFVQHMIARRTPTLPAREAVPASWDDEPCADLLRPDVRAVYDAARVVLTNIEEHGKGPWPPRAKAWQVMRAYESWKFDRDAAAEMESGRVSGVCFLLMRDGCVVLEQCPKKARAIGIGEWFVPGGKVEGEESAEAACLRELAEEWPGVDVLSLDPLPIVEGSPVPPVAKVGAPFLMRPFVVTVRGDVPPVSGDGVPLRWVSIAEAMASPVPQVRMMVAAALASRASARPGVEAMFGARPWQMCAVHGAQRFRWERGTWRCPECGRLAIGPAAPAVGREEASDA